MKHEHMTEDLQPDEFDASLHAFADELHEELQSEAWQGWDGEPPELPDRKPQSEWRRLGLAAALLLALALGVMQPWKTQELPSYLAMLQLESQGEASAPSMRRLRQGEQIETGPGQTARIEVAELGHLTLDANSRLSVGDSSEIDGEHYLQLERGAVTASIFASPRIFQLGTPGGIAVDLGCVYRAEIDADGQTRIRVIAGAVSLEAMGAQVYVPQGASVWARPGKGPGIPIDDETDPEVRRILRALDAGGALGLESEDFQRLFERARPADSLSIWHLMSRAQGGDRFTYAKLLDRLVPMPEGFEPDECVRAGSEGFTAWRALQPWG
jgi:ferric-dicitrate binding protein FerR (iron transport regulator)